MKRFPLRIVFTRWSKRIREVTVTFRGRGYSIVLVVINVLPAPE